MSQQQIMRRIREHQQRDSARPLGTTQLADQLDLSREDVNRLLRMCERQGMIDLVSLEGVELTVGPVSHSLGR